jgi:hypothetical protein
MRIVAGALAVVLGTAAVSGASALADRIEAAD